MFPLVGSTPPESFLESLERYLEEDEYTPTSTDQAAIDDAKRCSTKLCVFSKEPYILPKEPQILAKGLYFLPNRSNISPKEPCILPKEPCMLQPCKLQPVPWKMRLEMVIGMKNEIRIQIMKLLF